MAPAKAGAGSSAQIVMLGMVGEIGAGETACRNDFLAIATDQAKRRLHEVRRHAMAAQRGWHMVPSFHPDLVAGVASYALELFDAVSPLDAVVVPIGLGSGACGVIAARDALGLSTEVIGVVSSGAPAYALSLEAGRVIAHEVTTVLADGMACRLPDAAALDCLHRGLAGIVQVSDAEIAVAMRLLFECTHQVAEGAGAAALAAVLQQRKRFAGRRVAVILSGGNVDRDVFAQVLSADPAPRPDR